MPVLRTFDPALLMRLTTLENSHWRFRVKPACGTQDRSPENDTRRAPPPDKAESPTRGD